MNETKKPEPTFVDGMPRRCRVDLATEPERLIRDARDFLESSCGASTRLTDAVIYLGKALDAVADHVETYPDKVFPVSTKNKVMNEPVNIPCNTPMCGTEPAKAPEFTPRKLTDHKDGGALNDDLHITVVDPPGFGGASHVYSIAYGFNPGTDVGGSQEKCRIEFQNGPVPEHGVNGISQEALLAIVIDRLRSFQSGKFACRENALALTKLEEALHWLQHRTRDRINRGVLGTLNK